MKDIKRDELYVLSRHSDLTESELEIVLEEHVYNNRVAWEKFLKLFFITLGVGFTVSGIIFFFAFNWADLNKFVKIGLIEALLIASTVLVLFLKVDLLIRNILLTASAVLVGVLFAIFGQVYQTGADAYDFFLAWTLFIAIWVFVSNFAPLWLIFFALINVTFGLYLDQVASGWSELTVFSTFFVFNALIVLSSILIIKFRRDVKIPAWFMYVFTLIALFFAVSAMVFGIFDDYRDGFPILLSFVILFFGLGIGYGLRNKNGFFIAAIAFALIVIINAMFVHANEEESSFLFVGLFTIASITGLVKYLIGLQKKGIDAK